MELWKVKLPALIEPWKVKLRALIEPWIQIQILDCAGSFFDAGGFKIRGFDNGRRAMIMNRAETS